MVGSKLRVDDDIFFGDPGQTDAAGVLKVSQPTTILECKMLHDLQVNWHNDLTVVGGAITYLPNESAASLSVGIGATDRVVRESIRYAPYVPGSATRTTLTGVLGPQKANNLSRIGLFNDKDGIFFERNATDVRLVIRSSVSGASVDTNFYALGGAAPAGWTVLDALDGTGSPVTNPSGKLIDWTKTQFFYIDYVWQGVATVRFGVWLDGGLVIIAQYTGSNLLTVAYMASPTLPVRYEIANTGVPVSGSSMKEICWTVRTEGKFELPGVDYATGLGITSTAVIARRAILAIRMAATYNAKTNRRLAQLIAGNFLAAANSAYIEIVHQHADFTSTLQADGITPATWAAVSADSGVEVSKNIASVVGGTAHLVSDMYLASGTGQGFTSGELSLDPVGQHSWIANNMDASKSQMFIVYATSFVAQASNVSASLEFHEVE